MMVDLQITSDFETSKNIVIAAMLYPSSADWRASYCLRNRWAALTAKDDRVAWRHLAYQ